jgi:hypothetical protein
VMIKIIVYRTIVDDDDDDDDYLIRKHLMKNICRSQVNTTVLCNSGNLHEIIKIQSIHLNTFIIILK